MSQEPIASILGDDRFSSKIRFTAIIDSGHNCLGFITKWFFVNMQRYNAHVQTTPSAVQPQHVGTVRFRIGTHIPTITTLAYYLPNNRFKIVPVVKLQQLGYSFRLQTPRVTLSHDDTTESYTNKHNSRSPV